MKNQLLLIAFSITIPAMIVPASVKEKVEAIEERIRAAGKEKEVKKREAKQKLSIEELNKLLLEGATEGNLKIIQDALERGANINSSNDIGITPLIRAAFMGHDHLIKFLLDNGAKINQRDFQGDSALMSAALEGHKKTVEILLSNGANPTFKNEDGLNALNLARMKKHEDIVKLLTRAQPKRKAKTTGQKEMKKRAAKKR